MTQQPAPSRVPISVVIPAYNAERFLPETLASVAAQTVAPAEIIVVDAGSTDRTAELAREAGATVASQSNAGTAAARNAGIRRASEAWVILLDADDIWQPTLVERAWRALQAAPDADYALTDYSGFDEHGERSASVIHDAKRHALALRETPLGDDAYRFDAATIARAEVTDPFVNMSSFVIRRELARDLGFDPEFYGEDVEFCLRLFARPGAGVFIDAPLVRYRHHAASKSASALGWVLAELQTLQRLHDQPALYGPFAFERARSSLVPSARRSALRLIKMGEFDEASRAWAVAMRYGDRSPRVRALALATRMLRVVPGSPAARAVSRALRGLRRFDRP